MKQVQYLIIRSVEYSAQRRQISHEVWLVIALDEQLHPEYLSHGSFREIPVACLLDMRTRRDFALGETLSCDPRVSGGCPVYHQTRGRIWDMRPWRLCFFNTRPIREGFAGRPGSHLRLVKCWWRRPIPDQICSPCSSMCTRLEDTGCLGEQGKSRYPSCVD